MQHRILWTALFTLGLTAGIGITTVRSARAIEEDILVLLTTPLEPSLFQPGEPVLDPSIVTPNRISQTGITPPSLWWTQEQYGKNLLSYWLAYPGTDGTPRRVDLLVDQQVWNVYNYVERYAFVNQFGTAAKDYGYNVRVFDLQGELLGAYVCNFSNGTGGEPGTGSTFNANVPCSIFLNASGRGAFRGNTSPFGALSPSNSGTGQN